MRVLIGYTNIAALGMRMKKGFTDIGVKADFYSKDIKLNKYDYKSGFSYKKIKNINNRILNLIYKFYFLIIFTFRYKYFIYISAGSALLTGKKEVWLLQKFGKKFMLIYTGCDARLPAIVASYKWNPCGNCTDDYKTFVNCKIESKLLQLNNDVKLFDVILSPDECSGYFNEQYTTAYFPINLEEYEVSNTRNKKIRILHAPSNEEYKGTKYIDEVINQLSEKYDLEYVKIRNVGLEQLYEEIKKSDIIIDQMLVGFYGLFAVEAMAFGKPVFCYIYPDIWEKIKNDCPVINANPDTLVNALENLLQKPETLEKLGRDSRTYVEKYHDSKKIAKEYIAYFENARLKTPC